MNKHVFLAYCILTALVTTVASAAEKAGPTTSLFDGESLAGWTIENGCKATVEDKTILLQAGNGWLRSDHVYRDFVMHVEWRALQKEAYDSGIYIRTQADGAPFPKKSYQINLKEGLVGNIKNLPGAIAATDIHPPGEWNAADITVVGDTIEMVINDKPIYKVGGLKFATGYVGLQCEVILGGQFQFRNVSITELDAKSLFNGRDLTGWEGAGESADKCWRVVDGVLECTGQKGPWLRSAEQAGDFNLRLEYQVSKGGNSGVYVRVPADGNHHRDNKDAPAAGFEIQILDDDDPQYKDLKDYQFTGSVYDLAGANKHVGRGPGKWNSLEINCREQHVTITHNGQIVVDATPKTTPLIELRQTKGFLSLQNHSTLVRFRNLRLAPAY